jgi:prepilin-type processing-associated H-X9-DG protein
MIAMKYRTVLTKQDVLVSLFCVVFLLMTIGAVGNSGREHAKVLVCQSNLKKLVSAANLWSQDNDGWCSASFWSWAEVAAIIHKTGGCSSNPCYVGNPSSLTPYSGTHRLKKERGGVYACPSAKDVWLDSNPYTGSHEFETPIPQRYAPYASYIPGEKMYNHSTYAMNGWLCLYYNQGPPVPAGKTAGLDAIECSDNFCGPVERYYDLYKAINFSTNPYTSSCAGMNVHGNNRLDTIRQPAKTVYFGDGEYFLFEWQSFDPILADQDTYAKFALPGMNRWHNRKEGKLFGQGNYGWIDGHVSGEPSDFLITSPKEQYNQNRWTYYFWNH